MRRVAAELEVQPSALYHHVPNKQTLLALMADEIVGGLGEASPRKVSPGAASSAQTSPGVAVAEARRICRQLRASMLAVRDGADVVATASAFRLGASAVENRLAYLVGADGARTLLLYTFGQAQATQTHRQAAAFGALLTTSGTTEDRRDAAGTESAGSDLDASYERGIDLILAGLGAG